ncbi:energy-coupling factor transport system substrate-specific component [Humidesulfovibrio mexicanus]|uniref:Energy-coupling factor transport system substrate-specific component n=1 Tax=Humidesulfovibrio mexicanus TaxID=147047 RepID=A0A239BJH2_9BACT|nr:MptD family putative ECF transporter S component [Humidesulfovibrio mexicanus]SNS07508.1 energy-coupling factor transport system substrate-specific component [Humidesulfovibrio mexicanus]
MDAQSTMLTAGAASPASADGKRGGLSRRWRVSELITIGIFAAVIKVSSLAIALAGGGMNPVSLMLKNAVFTALLVVLLHKVRVFGTLTLFTLISAVVSLLLMGAGLALLPAMLLAGLASETLVMALGGYGRTVPLLLGVGCYDLLSKGLSLAFSWLMMREQPALMVTSTVMVTVGYAGSLLGLWFGVAFVKELRHAGIVRE